MESEKYLNDISEIKNLMTKSSRFTSLSGLSSIYTGIYGLFGGLYYYYKEITTNNYSTISAIVIFLIISSLSVLTTIYFTNKRAKIINEKAWDETTKQLINSFATILFIGTGFIIILLFQEKYLEAIPLVPLVYGLSLISAAKHTNNIVKPLGIIQIISSFLCLTFIEYSFWFYLFGFGVTHLINGLIIYYKYDKNN